PERLLRIDRDVARHQPDANLRGGEQALEQGGNAGVEAGLGAIEIGQRRQQALAVLLAELVPQVVRKLTQPAEILEELAPLLEALQIADGHAVAQKALFDGMEGV